MLHIKGSNTVLVALGSGEIHEVNIATYKRVSTIRSELFEDDPRRCAFSFRACVSTQKLLQPLPAALSY
jgi:hypothetical protein